LNLNQYPTLNNFDIVFILSSSLQYYYENYKEKIPYNILVEFYFSFLIVFEFIHKFIRFFSARLLLNLNIEEKIRANTALPAEEALGLTR
jgi:hypothetical protein